MPQGGRLVKGGRGQSGRCHCGRLHALDHGRTLPIAVAGSRDNAWIGGQVGGNAEAAAPLPGLGDDFLKAVKRRADHKAHAVDPVPETVVGIDVGDPEPRIISLD